MGRPPIKKTAMTAAERQRRRRARLRREQGAAVTKAKRAKARDNAQANYMPMPPGLTYWRKVKVQTAEGEQEIWHPTTRPIATLPDDLSDDDIRSLLAQLAEMVRARGL